MRVAALLAAALACTGALAQDWQAGVTTGRERLSRGQPPWRETAAVLAHRQDEGRVELGLRQSERRGTTDRELAAAAAWRFAPTLTAGLRASAADGRFLPRRGVAAEGAWQFADGLNLLAAVRRQWFRPQDAPASAVWTASADLEGYRGAWRVAAGLTQARLTGADPAHGARLQVDRYFGDVSRLGLALGAGREVEAAPGAVVSTRVASLALLIRVDVADGWALDLNLGRTRVSDITVHRGGSSAAGAEGYRREGVSIGIGRRF